MKVADALKELNDFANKCGLSIINLLPHDAVKLMIDFYTEVRAEDCNLEQDGDMLLFQWGIYNWGQQEGFFQYNITRQFIIPELDKDEDNSGEEEAIWQLALTLKYLPLVEDFRNIEAGNKWCSSPVEIDNFALFIQNCEATALIQSQEVQSITLEYNQT